MKKKTTLFNLSLVIVLLAGCTKIKDRMMDNMLLSYDVTSFLSHQVNFMVVNANLNSKTMPNAKITISGRNANEVFDINGGKEIAMSKGFGDAVVSPGKNLSTPMVFNVTATAEGFIPLTKTITIQPKDSFSVHALMMLEINNLPQGVDVETVNIDPLKLSSTNFGISSSTFDGEVSQKVNMNLPSGMVLYDENRTVVADPVSIKVVNYNGANGMIRSLLPPNIHCTSNHLIKNGIEDEEAAFIPINMIDLTINSGNKKIASTSKPIQTTIELDPNTYNAMTSENLKIGDPINIYFRKSADDNWGFVKESITALNTNGKYFVNLDVFQTGQYVAMAAGGKVKATCTNNFTITFTRPTNVNTLHDVEIRNGNNNKLLFDYPLVPVCEGCTFTLPDKLPLNTPITVIVYEFDYSDYKGRSIKNTTKLPACPSTVTIDVDPLKVNGNPLLKFNLATYCPNQPGSIVYYHDGRINYRFYQQGRWLNLGLAKKGVIEVDRLLFDNYYEFQTKVTLVPNGSTKAMTKPYTRARWSWRDPTLFGEPAEYGSFIQVPGTNTWVFNRLSWIAPETACGDFGY